MAAFLNRLLLCRRRTPRDGRHLRNRHPTAPATNRQIEGGPKSTASFQRTAVDSRAPRLFSTSPTFSKEATPSTTKTKNRVTGFRFALPSTISNFGKHFVTASVQQLWIAIKPLCFAGLDGGRVPDLGLCPGPNRPHGITETRGSGRNSNSSQTNFSHKKMPTIWDERGWP